MVRTARLEAFTARFGSLRAQPTADGDQGRRDDDPNGCPWATDIDRDPAGQYHCGEEHAALTNSAHAHHSVPIGQGLAV